MMRMSGFTVSCLLLASSMAVAEPMVIPPCEARWIVPHGTGTREIKAILRIEPDAVVLQARSGDILRVLRYESLTTVAHATTRHRRWGTGLVLGTLVNPLGYGFLFTKAKRNFITFFQDDVATVIKLDNDGYAEVLAAVAGRMPDHVVRAAW